MRKLILAILMSLSGPALAADALKDAPQRKHGLWEITMETGGHRMAMQHCVGAGTDRVTHQAADKMQSKDCSKTNVRRQGNKIVVDSVCKLGGTTATSRMEFSGDYTSNYRGDFHSRYEPPMHGMKEARQTLTARWTGPCKPGQRPGDVIMPGMGGRGGPGGFNMQDMMERMKR